jgi:hypothetical protein
MTTLPNHANSNHIYHYSAHLLKYKYIMKKIFTLILAALAISLGASADETSLRDQLVGLYSGSAQGGDYSTPPSYDWVNLAFNYGEDGNKLVDVAAGEADNEVVFTNFFPAMEGFEESGMVGKVTANTD